MIKIVRKTYIEQLEKETEVALRDRISIEKHYKDKLKEIKKTIDNITTKSKTLNKNTIVQILKEMEF